MCCDCTELGPVKPCPERRARLVPDRAGNRGEWRGAPTDWPDSVNSSAAVQPADRRSKTQASQAESASSILVTRSMIKAQVSDLGFVCCLDQFGGT